jgi:hypothetical protein
MTKIYKWLLWYGGFQEGDTISYMLARQKERMGKWWWTAPITTMVFTTCILGLQIWLTLHIVALKLKGK